MNILGAIGFLFLGFFFGSTIGSTEQKFKNKETFTQAITDCASEVAKKNKEIELELMYRCNNNYCVNYGRHYYLFQCVTNKMEAK